MTSKIVRAASSITTIAACSAGIVLAQTQAASWLDHPKPATWNKPGAPLPSAPRAQANVDQRCRDSARPPELEEDKRLRDKGWNLAGAYQGGWQIRVIRATANYDGMCRPRQYQGFVFVQGVFAGTLSPQVMDGRTDGALSQVFIESRSRLTAQYARYAATDALCCPSRTTSVVLDIAKGSPVVQPVSTSTSPSK